MLFQTEKLSSFHCCKLWILLYFFVNIESIASELRCDLMPPPVNGHFLPQPLDKGNALGSLKFFGCDPNYKINSQAYSSYCSYNFVVRKAMWDPPSPPECEINPIVPQGCYEDSRIDLVFVLDGSGSISAEAFKHVKTWTKNVGEHMIDVFEHHVHIGIVQFSTHGQIESNVKIYQNIGEFDEAVDNINQLDGQTYTVDGMKKALEALNVDRPKCPGDYQKIMVLLTDGQANVDASGLPNQAKLVKDADVISFAVGVKGADDEELRIITNYRDDRIYKIDDFHFLDDHAHEVHVGIAKTLGITCDQLNDPPNGAVSSCTHGNHLGSKCRYTCNPGYEMPNSFLSTTYCKVQTAGVGGWSSIPPHCILKCIDRAGSCGTWKTLGFCTNHYHDFMAKICPKTCNFCK